MERMFQQNFCTFYLEFKHFGFYFYKTLASFIKIALNLFFFAFELFSSLTYLFFKSSTLYKYHSPTKRTLVERQYTMPHHRMF